MSNDFSAATGLMVTVDPLTWTDLSGDGARAFVADTPIGRFVFGTDNLGQAYHQDPDGGEDHPTEAAARQRAEAVHGMMLTERVGALGVTVAAVNAYSAGTAAAEPREGEAVAVRVTDAMIGGALVGYDKRPGYSKPERFRDALQQVLDTFGPLYAHPPAASSAARVAELEEQVAAYKRLERHFHASMRALEIRLVAALSSAAPEPKS